MKPRKPSGASRKQAVSVSLNSPAGSSLPQPVLPMINSKEVFAAAFDVSRETLSRLEIYAAALAKWQKTINLVAPKTLPLVWHRHFADSAQVYRLIPPAARRLVDLGSGAGFPGLVLAIMASDRHPETALSVTLVESDNRKAAFLREVARQLGIAVDIMSTRIESIEISANVASVDVITSRALAPLPLLFELIAPFFSPRCVALFLKGRSVEAELCDSKPGWRFSCELIASLTEADARIAVIRGLERKMEG